MDLLNRIVKWIEDKGLYQRERKTNRNYSGRLITATDTENKTGHTL
jgi:hypothetical protein